MRILVADDSPVSRRILELALMKLGHEAISACDGKEAWDLLQKEGAPRLAVLDWMMPVMDGVTLCAKIREQETGGGRYTYIILLTARSEKEDLVRGMESGADDYIIKPFNMQELRVRLRAGQRIIELQNALMEREADLVRLSMQDSLTGIPNRRAILEQLKNEMARCKREGKDLSLAILDMDHFKRVNDTYGHEAGDIVLRALVERAGSVVRPYDAVGRLGGEEFLLLIPGADTNQAFSVCERVRLAMDRSPVAAGSVRVPVTVSLGGATWDRVEDREAFIRRADFALYTAKNSGRNRVMWDETAKDRFRRIQAMVARGPGKAGTITFEKPAGGEALPPFPPEDTYLPESTAGFPRPHL